MLESFLAARLKRYVKGLSAEHISARLLSGKFQLVEVELNVEALADLLFGLLPYTVEITQVTCQSVVAKVPWKALRRKPIRVTVSGVEVHIVVHNATNEALLERQTRAQRLHLEQARKGTAVEEIVDEEEESRRELKDVETQLKVHLKNIIVDGLQFNLDDFKVVVQAATAWVDQSGDARTLPSFAFHLGTVATVPCTTAGVQVDRPEDIYESSDEFIRLSRRVEIVGLRLESAGFGEDSTTSRLRFANDEHVRISIQERRLAGFLPGHKAKRVCPFSSEGTVRVDAGYLEVRVPEKELTAIISIIANACSPSIVPVERLPSDLKHLHWRQEGANAEAMRTPIPLIDPKIFTWTAYKAGTGAISGLELREQLVERRLVRMSEVSLYMAGASVALASAASNASVPQAVDLAALAAAQSVEACSGSVPDVSGTVLETLASIPTGFCTFCALAWIGGFTFNLVNVFPVDKFERRCLVELGLAKPNKSHISGAVVSDVTCTTLALPSQIKNGRSGDGPAMHMTEQHASRLPLMNAFEITLDDCRLRWRPGSIDVDGRDIFCQRQGDMPLLRLERQLEKPCFTIRVKQADTRVKGDDGCFIDHGWQPVEGCIHKLRVVLDGDACIAFCDMTKRVSGGLLEKLHPPEIEACWTRFAVHELSLELPQLDARPALAVNIPALQITHLFGLGELFHGLTTIFVEDRQQQIVNLVNVAAEVFAKRSQSKQLASERCWSELPAGCDHAKAAIEYARASSCPCCRLFGDGNVRLGHDFVPAKEQQSYRAWEAEHTRSTDARSGCVAVEYDDLIELLCANVKAAAAVSVLPGLRANLDSYDLVDAMQAADDEIGSPPSFSSPSKKDKHKKDKKDKKEVRSSASQMTSVAVTSEVEAQALAQRLVTLQESLRKKRFEQDVVQQRCAAIRSETAVAVSAAEHRAQVREQLFAGRISDERARQANLAAKAAEQQKALDLLLRGLSPSAVLFPAEEAAADQA